MKTIEKMNFTQLRVLVQLSIELDIDKNELFDELESKNSDFNVGDFRFIDADEIDQIQCDELESDLYILGCFTDWFLADILDIDIDVIKAMQEAEAFEAIGKLVISMDKLKELQEEYSRLDGYGHHFNHYNGNENEISLNGVNYYYFRTN